MSKTRRGFTLVELLAVIVILAVILVIAVPQIMNVITESRKGALISSAKLIASSAESAYASNQALDIEREITCSDVAQINSEDYASCSIAFVDGKAKVTIVGKGKFEGIGVLLGTSDNVTATYGLEKTSDGNIRYTGTNPSNYIKFNGEDWRIIGIFNVTTASGTTEKLMKIVRNEQFTQYMSWDSSASSVNNGGGVNEWSQADLMTMLNTYYIGTSTTCSYCNSKNQSTCSNDCSSSVTPIGSTYTSMIEEVVWSTGAFEWDDNGITVETAYNAERGTTTGKKCASGTYCNDSVTRTTEWTGKVGLIYPSDYGYASTSGTDIGNSAIGTTNWLKSGLSYWTLSTVPNSARADYAGWVSSNGYVSWATVAYNGNGVRPAIYLKSDVSITSGDGSSSNPYQISMD